VKASNFKFQTSKKFQARNSQKSFWLFSKARSIKSVPASFGIAVALGPDSLRACAACYGQADGPMATGMNWGIFSLLTVVVGVLGTIAVFFIYLARRAAAASQSADGGNKLTLELQTGASLQPSITTHCAISLWRIFPQSLVKF
jgi:hypothetical protein